MPELPEVETIRIYLHEHILGKAIKNIEILNAKSFIGDTSLVIGQTIIDTSRKGKVLNLKLSNEKYMSFHLKMSGQIFYSSVGSSKSSLDSLLTSVTRVVITFTDSSTLFFNNTRKFGWVKVTDTEEGTKAPDVTRNEFTLDYFKNIVQHSSKPIKVLLMDQEKLAGVGNIYANDALFVARIHPLRKSNTLSNSETDKLYTAVKSIIEEGLQFRGSSASQIYRMPDGTKGTYQEHFKVYGREGKPCYTCGSFIFREKQGGRSSFYCKNCQK